MEAKSEKSRVVFILLGLFLGMFGAHNWYAGYSDKALYQLLITLLTFWLILPLFAVAIWVLIEVCTIDRDADGLLLR